MHRIDILVFDGFDELDAIGPYEVFRNGGLDARVVALDGPRTITASHGLTIHAEAPRGEDVDAVLVPGGGYLDGTAGVRIEIERGDLVERLKQLAAAGGITITSVCTGAMLLAAAGITDGRPATTHHGAHEALAASGAQLVTERVVDDGDLITSGGVTSGIDMAMWIVERSRGADVAQLVAQEMEHERADRVRQMHG
jgi:transcriptional regulator GlxA family with amidase domain